MKRKFWPLLSLFLCMSGCGVDWFPASTPATTTTPTTLAAPTLTAALSPTSIASGGNSTLTLTITNKTGNPAQTGLQFQEQIPSGVTVTNPVSNCGGTAETTTSATTGTFIIFQNGALASGAANCTITASLGATVGGAAAQSFVIKTADFTGFGGGLVSGVTDQTLTVTPVAAAVLFPTLTAVIKPAAMLDGGSSALTFVITNNTAKTAQSGMGFSETLPTGFKASVTTASQCGGNLAVAGSSLIFISGQLASGAASCTLSADLSLGASLLNTITAEQTFSVKNADFSSFQGTLVSGVTTDQSFKVFPTAVTASSGGVTVSSLTPVGNSDATQTKVNFTFNADTSSTAASAVSATVTVVGVDATGAQIAATLTPLSVSIPPGLLTAQVALGSTPVAVSNADAANIAFWRITSVTVP